MVDTVVDRLVVVDSVVDTVVEHGLVNVDSVVDCCWLMVDSMMGAMMNNSMVGPGQSNVEKYEAEVTLHLECCWLLVVGTWLLVVGLY